MKEMLFIIPFKLLARFFLIFPLNQNKKSDLLGFFPKGNTCGRVN